MTRSTIIKQMKQNNLWDQLSGRQQMVLEDFVQPSTKDKQWVASSRAVVMTECKNILRDNGIS